jgi:hypothetical protein
MNVYGYSRVSTQMQVDDGAGLDVQRRQIEGYALMHGFELVEIVVEEGVSGSVPIAERPAGGKLFAKLKKGDIVIAPKLESPVPLGARCVAGCRDAEGEGRLAASSRPWRRRFRQRHVEGLHDDRRLVR